MVANSRENSVPLQAISHQLSSVFHNVDINLLIQAVNIVWNGVTAPEHSIWLHIVLNVVQQVLHSNLRRIAHVVTPLSSRLLRGLRQTTL